MTRGSPESVAVVVATPNRDLPRTRALLASLRETAPDARVEIMESSGPDFCLSRSWNRAIERVGQTDYVVIQPDDVVLRHGWLDGLLTTARLHPEVGIVGSLLAYPDGRPQHMGGFLPVTPRLRWKALLIMTRKLAPFYQLRRWKSGAFSGFHHTRIPRSKDLHFVTGTTMLVTRPCWEAVGPFDEGYRFGAEDMDFNLLARESGFRIGLSTTTVSVHHEGRSYSKPGSPWYQVLKVSEARFMRRWPLDRILRAVERPGIIWPHPGHGLRDQLAAIRRGTW